jgi:hypothetical protein
MKIKTIIFWILWVGNNLTLQTVSGEDLEPVSPPLFPDGTDDVYLLCQTLGLTAPQKEQEQVQQLAEALRPPLETVCRQARDAEAPISKLADQLRPRLSTEQQTKSDPLRNVLGSTPDNFGIVRTGIDFAV